MSPLATCTIVWEYNYPELGKGPGKGSVWLREGDGRGDLEVESPFEEFPGWVKIIGPVDQEISVAVCDALKEFFERCGVTVIREGVAD